MICWCYSLRFSLLGIVQVHGYWRTGRPVWLARLPPEDTDALPLLVVVLPATATFASSVLASSPLPGQSFSLLFSLFSSLLSVVYLLSCRLWSGAQPQRLKMRAAVAVAVALLMVHAAAHKYTLEANEGEWSDSTFGTPWVLKGDAENPISGKH